MSWVRKVLLALLATLLIGGWLFLRAVPLSGVSADDDPPADGRRTARIQVPYDEYQWWLIRWKGNQIVCNLTVEHDGIPTLLEIEGLCGLPLLQEWIDTQPCTLQDGQTTDTCPGLYFHLLGATAKQREVVIDLDPAAAYIAVEGCNPQPPDNRCASLPRLKFIGEEPLPNEQIVGIRGTINGESFQCEGAECSVPISPTGMDGVPVVFWADSSFGDSTEQYTAMVRLVPWGDFMNPEGGASDSSASYFIDVLSSQWKGGYQASCSETWQAFPEVGGPPAWLTSPDTVEGLESDIGYYYLAGALIQNGMVDTSACLDGGLQAPNVASVCGVEAARPALTDWQNRFDKEILEASKDTGVPAMLLKNVFSRESQIWPGIFKTYREAGLGQLTENGADTVLLWNPGFFQQFCPLVLSQETCDLGFGNLEAKDQQLLRGALVTHVNAACPDCPTGVDLSQASYSVDVFAEGLNANCVQVGQMITNTTERMAGQTSSYSDLWRFTLVNYNAGSGCLGNAIQKTWGQGQALTWENVSANLEPVCQAAIGYVEDISLVLRSTPTPTPWIAFPTVEATPTLLMTLTPTSGPSQTPGGPTATPQPSMTPGGPTVTITPTSGTGYDAPQPTEDPGYTGPTYP